MFLYFAGSLQLFLMFCELTGYFLRLQTLADVFNTA